MSSLEYKKLKDDIPSTGDIGDEQKMFPGEFCDTDSAYYVKLEPINNDCNVQTFCFYAFMLLCHLVITLVKYAFWKTREMQCS